MGGGEIPDRVQWPCRTAAAPRCWLHWCSDKSSPFRARNSRRRRDFRSAYALRARFPLAPILVPGLPRRWSVTWSCSPKMSSSAPVEAICPKIGPGASIDELRRDANAVRRLAHTSFHDVAHAQLTPNLLHVDRAPLVGEARIARDDEQPAHARQRRDDVLDDAVGEVFLLRITAQVLERQNGDRRRVRKRQSRCSAGADWFRLIRLMVCRSRRPASADRAPPRSRRRSGNLFEPRCGSGVGLRRCRRWPCGRR